MSLVDLLDAMAKYFEVTGVNPKDQVILSPAEELKKFRDTIISFMRKQENDFIKPTFGKMDTLIARFIKYIEEEAPKSSDVAVQNKMKSLALSGEIVKEGKKGYAESETVKSDVNTDQYKTLQEKCDKLDLKLRTTKEFGRDIKNISQLTAIELKRYEEALKDYTRKVMDDYAKNFNRGLTGESLVYFGKVEHTRYHGRDSAQVKEGLYKAGGRTTVARACCSLKNGRVKEDPLKPDGKCQKLQEYIKRPFGPDRL